MIPLKWHHQPANQTCWVGGTAGQKEPLLAWAPLPVNQVMPAQVGETFLTDLLVTENFWDLKPKSKLKPDKSVDLNILIILASAMPSMSKAKSQTFDPFADLGNLSSNLPGRSSCKLRSYSHKRGRLSILWAFPFISSPSFSCRFLQQ